MKRPRLIIILLLLAASVLIASEVSTEEDVLANDTDNRTYSTLPVQVDVATPDDTYVELEPVESRSSADAGLIQPALANQPEPLIQPEPLVQPEPLILNDQYFDKQWALIKIEVSRLWQVTTGSQEVLVAVLDTGIDQNHEDLNGKVAVEVNLTDSFTAGDLYGHGTHIAGIIAADSNNSVGIVGVAPESQLMNVKVADDKGGCQASVVAKGIVWAVDRGAHVINVSVEIREPSPELEEAVNYAWSHGSLIVAAAGNDGSGLPVYPAYYENCIAVAATNQDDNLAPLSNHGDWVDVAAPGFDIYSTLPDNSYGHKTGTSFATAYVSGIAALLFDVVTDNNDNCRLNDEVRAAIEASCQEIGIGGVGRGRIDASQAMAQVCHAS